MKEIHIDGFTTDIQPNDALAIAVFGMEGSGKSRFLATAPDPIGVIPLERKSRRTISQVAREFDRTVLMPEEDMVRVSNPMKVAMMDDPELIKYYRAHVDKVKRAAYTLYAHPDVRTIGIDSATQLWEDMMFANYGRLTRVLQRDRGLINQEFTQFVNNLSGKNLILLHHSKEIYKNDKGTGKYAPAGYPRIGHLVNCTMELVNDPSKGEGDDERFVANIVMCQSNPAIQGPGGKALLTDDSIMFDALAYAIDPDWGEQVEAAQGKRDAKRMIKAVQGKKV